MLYALFALCAALQLADGWTTVKVLQLGGVEENPVMSDLIDHFGVSATMIAVKLAVIGLLAWGTFHAHAFDNLQWVLGLVAALYVVIVRNNLQVLKRQKQIHAAAGQ
jgi:uncharacterized protein DUF5658